MPSQKMRWSSDLKESCYVVYGRAQQLVEDAKSQPYPFILEIGTGSSRADNKCDNRLITIVGSGQLFDSKGTFHHHRCDITVEQDDAREFVCALSAEAQRALGIKHIHIWWQPDDNKSDDNKPSETSGCCSCFFRAPPLPPPSPPIK